MKTLKFNPRFELTAEQTDELRRLWEPICGLVEPSKNTLMKLKLSRRAAVFSRRQLYMAAATMINLGVSQVPDWVHEMLDRVESESDTHFLLE